MPLCVGNVTINLRDYCGYIVKLTNKGKTIFLLVNNLSHLYIISSPVQYMSQRVFSWAYSDFTASKCFLVFLSYFK